MSTQTIEITARIGAPDFGEQVVADLRRIMFADHQDDASRVPYSCAVRGKAERAWGQLRRLALQGGFTSEEFAAAETVIRKEIMNAREAV